MATVDNETFERIKAEQSINVSYTGFVDYLLQILDGCRRDELHLAVVENAEQKYLQLYEKRPFKNLTHLFLPMIRAPTKTALFHMNVALQMLQNQVLALQGQMEGGKAEVVQRDAEIRQLQTEMQVLRDKLKEKDALAFQRESDEIRRLSLELKSLQDAKDGAEKHFRQELRQLQDKFDRCSREVALNRERCEAEVKKQDLLKEEIGRLKPFLQANHKLQLDLDQAQSKSQRYEAKITEVQRLYTEAQEQLRQAQKNEQELRAEAEAERNIASSKRNALQLATEEISSANRIILQQKKDLEKLRAKIDVRTELALKQEKVVQQKEKENSNLQNIVRQLRSEYEASKLAKTDVLDTIEALQDSADLLEHKYQRKISELANTFEQSDVRRIKERYKY